MCDSLAFGVSVRRPPTAQRWVRAPHEGGPPVDITPASAGEEGSMVRHERRLVAALEDEGTAAAVARDAARVAPALGAGAPIEVHMLYPHTIARGLCLADV